MTDILSDRQKIINEIEQGTQNEANMYEQKMDEYLSFK